MTENMPIIPEKYRRVIDRYLEQEWKEITDVTSHYFGVQWTGPAPSPNDLLTSPLGQVLAGIARCAVDQMLPNDPLGWIEDGIESVKHLLFMPVTLDTYEIPDRFWTTGLGEMLALATKRINGDNLVTIAEASRMLRVKTEYISSKIRAGRLQKFFNPNAPQNQGRWLVSRQEVEELRNL